MVICKLGTHLSTLITILFLSNGLNVQLSWGSETYKDEENRHHVVSPEVRSIKSIGNWCKGSGSYQDGDNPAEETVSQKHESDHRSVNEDDGGSSSTNFQNTPSNFNARSLSWEDWYFDKINIFWKRSEGWYNRLGTGLTAISVFLKSMLFSDELSDDSKLIISSVAIFCDGGSIFFHNMENYATARNAKPYATNQRILLRSASTDEEETCCTKCFKGHDCCIRVMDGWINATGAVAAAAGGFCTTITTTSHLSFLAQHIFTDSAIICSGISCACHFLGSYVQIKKSVCGNGCNCLENPGDDYDQQTETAGVAIPTERETV